MRGSITSSFYLAALLLAACGPTASTNHGSTGKVGSTTGRADAGTTSRATPTTGSGSTTTRVTGSANGTNGGASTGAAGTTGGTTSHTLTTTTGSTSGAASAGGTTGTTGTTGSSSTTGGPSGTTGGTTGLPLCSPCASGGDCASGWCTVDPSTGDGFCDSTNACTSSADCGNQYACDTATGACACPGTGGTATTGGSTTASSTGGSGGQPICAQCTSSADCASNFCTADPNNPGIGFCDSTNPCASTSDCDNQYACDTASGSCICSGSTAGTSGGSTGTSGGCTACTTSTQCGTGNHCLKETGGTNYYCGADCTSDPNVCPAGFTCSTLSSGKKGCRSVSPTCP